MHFHWLLQHALVNLENSPEEQKTLALSVYVADRPQPINSAPPLFRYCSSKHIARDCLIFTHACRHKIWQNSVSATALIQYRFCS